MAKLTNTTKANIDRYAKEHGLSPKVCEKAYSDYWDWVRKVTDDMKYASGLNSAQFHRLPTGVDIEGLGVLYVPFRRYQKGAKSVNYEEYNNYKNRYRKNGN